MRVAAFVDLRLTSSATPTGVGKHVAQIVPRLASNGVAVEILATRDQLDVRQSIPAANALAGLPVRPLPLKNGLARASWSFLDRPKVDPWCPGADWLYCPFTFYVPFRQGRTAFTFHGDYQFDRTYPGFHTWPRWVHRTRWAPVYRKMASRGDLILCVSELVKRQMVDWFGAKPEQIVVIGNGVEDIYFQVAREEPGRGAPVEEGPYLLAVGGLNALDGGETLLQTAQLLKEKAPNWRLLIAGQNHEPALLRRAEGMSNVRLLGYVAAPRLARLMRGALALLYLPGYETFGIIGVEALVAGTPVITHAVTAVPEVLGSAALYVATNQPGALVEATLALASQASLRQDLVARGQAQGAQYTWEACAGRLRKALQDRL